MEKGRAEAEWGRAAALMALLANINRDSRRGKAYEPRDFMPAALLRRHTPRAPARAGVEALKVFVTNGKQRK